MAHPRVLEPGQRSQIWVGGSALDEPELLFETDQILIEAPNWSLDGQFLFLNGDGALLRFDVANPGQGLIRIDFDIELELNNDHVLDPDGKHIYMSAMDGHVYRGGLAGGAVEKVTPDDGKWHFLHGVSPDGWRLAYVEIEDFSKPGRLAVMEMQRPPVIMDTGDRHIDGPEWSPDGKWIYFNTEGFTTDPGHAQLARIPDNGGTIEHLTVSNTVDWFPHLSPDSQLASYIAFPSGTLGHPANLDVEVRLVETADWSTPLQRYALFGGQGTINVNSWSPDSSRFAFIAYPAA